jgi:hemolysin activation/secretion protein
MYYNASGSPCERRSSVSLSSYIAVGLAGALLGSAAVAQQAPDAPPAHAASEATGAGSTPADSSDQSFDILEYRVLGNTVLEAREVERSVYPFLGPTKTLKDVEAARAALQTAYHDRGFGTVFVDIPEQSVADGIVRLRVSEGRLRRVAVTGARYFSGRQIKEQLPAARPEVVPNLPQLQNELTALNTQTPDRAVVPVLRAGPYPGTVDMGLKVDDHLPVHGSVELNNQRTPDTDSLRALGTLSYDDLFGRLDSLSLQYQTAPQSPEQVGVVAASYTARVSSAGAHLSFIFINSNSDVATIGTLGVLGKGKIYGMRFAEPLVLTAASSQNFTFGFDYKDFSQTINVSAGNGVNTPLRYLNWSAGYAGAWRGSSTRWNFDATGNFGVRGVPNTTQEFADKRFGAAPNYFYIRSNASVLTTLPGHFTGLLRVSGQYSVDPVVSNEQFTIGGADSVRGYLEAEELGDIGFRSTAQLNSPTLQLLAHRLRLTAFTFYDLGRVSTISPLPGEPANIFLRSAGVGLDLAAFDHLTGSFTWADPLVPASRTGRGDSRVLFIVNSHW